MALTTEDGTAKANAESFCTVSAATAYHNKRGNTAWEALDIDTQEQLLRKATDYMEQAYRERWDGYRKTNTQALSWPRYDVPMRDAALESYYADDAVPAQVVNACAELALKARTVTLAPDIGPQKKRVKVDVIETEYADGASQITQFRAIDNMLAPFLKNGGGVNLSVVRA